MIQRHALLNDWPGLSGVMNKWAGGRHRLHACEYGADRIYAGQLAVLKDTEVGPLIQHMWNQEKHHLATFEKLMPEKRQV